MINQMWGPFVDLTGDGGYQAATMGDWFVMKYANIVMFVAVATLFVVGMFVHLPEPAETDDEH